jgi:hypothetical protein
MHGDLQIQMTVGGVQGENILRVASLYVQHVHQGAILRTVKILLQGMMNCMIVRFAVKVCIQERDTEHTIAQIVQLVGGATMLMDRT